MKLDSQTKQLLGELRPAPDTPRMTIAEIGADTARTVSRAIFLAYAGHEPTPCEIQDLLLEGSAQPIPARLYHTPDTHWRLLPLVVFFHGGGWFQGDLDCYDFLMRDLCVRSGATMLSVQYRLAPEHRYPAALDDALAAVRWAACFTRGHGHNAARIAVMGDSAGGNLATVTARRLHTEGRIRLAAQFLLYPMLDVSKPHSAYPSRMRFGDGDYLLTRDSIDAAAAWYLDGVWRADDPDVSPLLAPDLTGLPETIIAVGNCDPLLDEATLYAERLRAARVPAHLERFDSAIHAFFSFAVLDVSQRGRAWLAGEIRRCLFA